MLLNRLCLKLVYDEYRESGVFLMVDQDHQPQKVGGIRHEQTIKEAPPDHAAVRNIWL